MTANLDIMAGDLSKLNELLYEDLLIQGEMVIYYNSRYISSNTCFVLKQN